MFAFIYTQTNIIAYARAQKRYQHQTNLRSLYSLHADTKELPHYSSYRASFLVGVKVRRFLRAHTCTLGWIPCLDQAPQIDSGTL